MQLRDATVSRCLSQNINERHHTKQPIESRRKEKRVRMMKLNRTSFQEDFFFFIGACGLYIYILIH